MYSFPVATKGIASMSEQENDGWAERLRADARRWLDENWDPALDVRSWWSRVADAGWTAPHFPADKGGGGLPAQAIRNRAGRVHQVRRAGSARRPRHADGRADDPHSRHARADRRASSPRSWTARVGWCQLFSEPGAGSDLAGLTDPGASRGRHYVINGQKVWSSQAREADYGMLLARTDFDAPKHAGHLLVRLLARPARRRRSGRCGR